MSDAGQPNYRLQDLKQRWEQNPSSRLYLQLAEEYRKSGQPAEAVVVLEEGLRSRPNDLSAYVALGKTRLELQQVSEAVDALHAVIAKDPAHLVANKLLLEAHLLAGDRDRAQERLDLYRLLNDRDPELEHLSFRLDQLRRAAKASATAEKPSPSAVAGGKVAGGRETELALETTPGLDLEPFRKVLSSGARSPGNDNVSESSRRSGISEEVATSGEDLAPFQPEVAQELVGAHEEKYDSEMVSSVHSSGDWEPVEEVPWMSQGEHADREVFPLGPGSGPLASGFESLWELLRSQERDHGRVPSSPFAELSTPSEEEYFDALQEEGIFSESLPLSAPGGMDPAEIRPDLPVLQEEPTEIQLEPPEIEPGPTEIQNAPEEANDSGSLDPWEAEALEPTVDGGGADATPDAPSSSSRLAASSDSVVEIELATDGPGTAELAPVEAGAEQSSPAEVFQEVELQDSPAPVASEPDDDELDETLPMGVMADPGEVLADSGSGETSEGASPAATPSPLSPWAVARSEAKPWEPESVSDQVDSSEPSGEGVGEEVATVTLGSLYLKQGHLDEAAKIFEKVLERDPQNHAALSGLNLARRPARTGLSALDLLADRSLSGTIPAGLTAKKILVLGNYLKHLKSVRKRDHVR